MTVRGPVDYRHPDYHASVYSLFDRYFSHILDHGEERYHPITDQLYALTETARASLDARALTLAVAIEALLNDGYAEVGQTSEVTVKQVDQAIQAVRASGIGADTVARLEGAMKLVRQASAYGKLKALVSLGATTVNLIKAWRQLRNRWAHGAKPESWDAQKVVDHYFDALTLFYHLMFHLVGYRGKYRDYSTPGWPQAEYPPARD